jgi:hypothetical protein
LPRRPRSSARPSASSTTFAVDLQGCYYPFQDAARSGQLAKPIVRGLSPHGAGTSNEMHILGFVTGGGKAFDLFQMHTPRAEITDRLFGEGPTDFGANKEQFFNEFLPNGANLDHYPPQDTSPRWWDRGQCTPKSLSGKALAAPSSVTLGLAARSGVAVAFDVKNAGSKAELSLRLAPGAGTKGSRLRTGSVLARQVVRELTTGNHTRRLTVSRATARLLRASRGHRATLRLRVTPPRGRAATVSRPITLRY